MALTALAGPASNLLMAFLSLAVLRVFYAVLPAGLALTIAYIFFYEFAWINVGLAIFNLLPHSAAGRVPDRGQYSAAQMVLFRGPVSDVHHHGGYAAGVSGALSRPISFLAGGIFNFFFQILMF